jgi:Asp-tRNA(Asn)/Glu-tRNA(Gln) amidotransferase A subunit family amidase
MPHDLDSCLAAIARREGEVRAFVDVAAADARRRAAHAEAGPLAGWPVAIKDIIDVAGLPTRCNSPLTSALPATADAAIVSRLKRLGAFVIGKSVTTTFAYFDAGPTRNPWQLTHTPGGSSSGSAAAVAAGFCRLAVGTQTGGSVIRPAAFCGVVGFKPSRGVLPTAGVYPLAPSLDTVGLFAGTVADIVTAFAAVTDSTAPVPSPRPLRIGVLGDQGCAPPDAEMLAAIGQTAAQLTAAGHAVTELTPPPLLRDAHGAHADLMAAEAAAVHAELFSERQQAYSPRLTELITAGQRVSDARLTEIRAGRGAAAVALDNLCAGLDLVLAAAAPGPAPTGLGATGDPRMNCLWTLFGCPAITLPAALSQAGLPLGVQLIAPAGRDLDLLAAAAMIEETLAFNALPCPAGA